MNKAEVDDIIQMKSPPWLMFAAKHNNSRKAISSEANDSYREERGRGTQH